MIREVLGTSRLPVFFAAILAVVLFAAPPQVSAGSFDLTAFTATPGDGKVTLKWSIVNAADESKVVYHYEHIDAHDGHESFRTCDTKECDVTYLVNGQRYHFDGWACEPKVWNGEEVQSCTNGLYTDATPTAE